MSDILFKVRDLSFSYGPKQTVLNEVSFDVREGEHMSLNGANGSGKSTLLHLMVGLRAPSSGTIEAFGRPRVHEADFFDVRARAGLLFQDPDDQLFCPTVFDDVAFGPLNLGKTRDQTHKIVNQTLDILGLASLKDRVTHHLSGGEKRLVTLAAVLAMEPEVLLLDEPTNALDEETETRLIEILKSLPQTLLLVSHDRSFREAVTTKSLTLKDGRINGSS